jgi:hypothetical protein
VRKTKVNHDAVIAIAATAPKKIAKLVERIRAVRLFVDMLNVDVFNEQEFHGFVRKRRDYIREVNGKDTTLLHAIRRLSLEFKEVNNIGGNKIIANATQMSDEQIANELLMYLVSKASETQQAEFERDEAKRAAIM